MNDCRACGRQMSQVRWDYGYDHCSGCADACRSRSGCSKPGVTIAVVGVAKSIPMLLPADSVDGSLVRSGTRRA